MKKLKNKKLGTHKKLPSLDLLFQKYDYNPLTGIITSKGTGKPIKCKPGCYGTLYVKNKRYRLHRIAFYMFHKRDPKDRVVDHINGIKSDNSICNLRACSYRSNAGNTKKKRDEGITPNPEPGTQFLWTMDRSRFLEMISPTSTPTNACSY